VICPLRRGHAKWQDAVRCCVSRVWYAARLFLRTRSNGRLAEAMTVCVRLIKNNLFAAEKNRCNRVVQKLIFFEQLPLKNGKMRRIFVGGWRVYLSLGCLHSKLFLHSKLVCTANAFAQQSPLRTNFLRRPSLKILVNSSMLMS
jgi:hypothetical protein